MIISGQVIVIPGKYALQYFVCLLFPGTKHFAFLYQAVFCGRRLLIPRIIHRFNTAECKGDGPFFRETKLVYPELLGKALAVQQLSKLAVRFRAISHQYLILRLRQAKKALCVNIAG